MLSNRYGKISEKCLNIFGNTLSKIYYLAHNKKAVAAYAATAFRIPDFRLD